MEKYYKRVSKKLDEIGVDGYLLDTVDTYQYFEENYKGRGCCQLINEVKNSLLLAKFLNDEKLTFAANSLSVRSSK